jgi:hypothetical protein
LKGDSRTVANQTGASITQLCITNGVEHVELLLRYRVAVSRVETGVENGLAVNNLRIYVINLNASESVSLYGSIPLRVSCETTRVTSFSYTTAYNPEAITVTSLISGVESQVSIPISSSIAGAALDVEVIECNVKIERSLL